MYFNDVYWLLLAPLHEGDLRQYRLFELGSGGGLMVSIDGYHRRPSLPHPNHDAKRVPASHGLFCAAP